MADCSNPLKFLECKAGEVVSGAVDSGTQNLGQAMMTGWDQMTKGFLTSWLDMGLLVDLDAGSVAWLTEQLQVISVFFAVVGIMVACIWTMLHFRGEKATKVAKSMFMVFLVTTLGTALVQTMLWAGDAFSDWVLDSAGVTTDAMAQLPIAGLAALSPGLAIIFGIFGIIATLIQWGIMLVRSALLPLLVGVWPATAAASMIGGAEEAFSKLTKWLLAFVLYKPVAAIVYAYAWKTKSGVDGIGGVINGLILIVLAVAALPALLRLLAPGTSVLGGAGGGSLAIAGGAAVVSAGVAAGAAVLTSGGSTAMTAGGATGKGEAAKGVAPSGAKSDAGLSTAGGVSPAAPSGPNSGSSPDGGSTVGGSRGGLGPSGPAAPGIGAPATEPTGNGPAAEGTPQRNTVSTAGGTSELSTSGSRSLNGQVAAKVAAQSMTGAVADGAKEANGRDVIGE